MRIADIELGSGRCLIIAEAGVNHNGDIGLAREMVDAAREVGADALKLQTFRAGLLAAPSAGQAEYQLRSIGRRQTQLEMLESLELTHDEHLEIRDRCESLGLVFLSTPFDEVSADMLGQLGVPAFKTSSGDLTHLGLLSHIARKQRPMIISTGMATLGEIEQAVSAVERAGSSELVLLHCVSDYPAAPEDVNLRAMKTLSLAFGYPVGLSDHTQGLAIALAAAALGATVIEKHFTLDRSLPGPDHQASLEPSELSELVSGVRAVEAALGDGRKRPCDSELEVAKVARRSLVAATAVPAGAELRADMLAVRRPGTGIRPERLEQIIGHRVRVALDPGEVLMDEHLEGPSD